MKTATQFAHAGSALALSAALVRAEPVGWASGGGGDTRPETAARPPIARFEPPPSADEVRALVAEMLSDAETRSSLLADGDGTTGGYDKGFMLRSADGNFGLVFSGYTQLRYLAVFRDDGRGNAATGAAGNDNSFENGFENRRTRLKFAGNIVNPDLTFVVQGEFSDSANGGNFFLRDAILMYQLGDGWCIRGGQYKLPFLREEYMDDTKRLAVEGSQATAAFNQGRSQAIELGFRKENYRVLMDFSDGLNTLNTDFATAAGAPNPIESDYAFTGRVDWSPDGKVSDFDEFTSQQDAPWAFNLGGAVHVQGSSNTRGPGGQADTTLLGYTADAMLKGGGWSLFAQFMGMSARRPNVPPPIAAASTDDYGLVLQAGYRFLKDDEAFGRYGAVLYDSDRGFVDDRQDFVAFGWNHYFAGHAAKLTVDVEIALQPTISAAGATLVPSTITGANIITPGQGLLRSADANAVAVRAQMQVMF